jgi:hypothetical protein
MRGRWRIRGEFVLRSRLAAALRQPELGWLAFNCRVIEERRTAATRVRAGALSLHFRLQPGRVLHGAVAGLMGMVRAGVTTASAGW